jgi:hypothetical protein
MITRPPKNDRPVKVGILVDTGIDCCVEFTSVPSAVAISRRQQRIGPRAIYVIALPKIYEISTQKIDGKDPNTTYTLKYFSKHYSRKCYLLIDIS